MQMILCVLLENTNDTQVDIANRKETRPFKKALSKLLHTLFQFGNKTKQKKEN